MTRSKYLSLRSLSLTFPESGVECGSGVVLLEELVVALPIASLKLIKPILGDED